MPDAVPVTAGFALMDSASAVGAASPTPTVKSTITTATAGNGSLPDAAMRRIENATMVSNHNGTCARVGAGCFNLLVLLAAPRKHGAVRVRLHRCLHTDF